MLQLVDDVVCIPVSQKVPCLILDIRLRVDSALRLFLDFTRPRSFTLLETALLLQVLDWMPPGQRCKSHEHGRTLEHVQTPFVLERIAFNPECELDQPKNGADLS